MTARSLTNLTVQGESRARFMPHSGDSMAPTLRHRDLVGVVPTDRFAGAGLYVLAFNDEPEVWRCQARPCGGIAVWHDSPMAIANRDRPVVVTREQFDDAVLAEVFGTVALLRPELLAAGRA